MIKLKYATSTSWIETVLQDFDSFLIDHAACERKASSMAMSMIAHYPDKPLLLEKMAELAVEELQHFKQVLKIMLDRNIEQKSDVKDPYVNQLRNCNRNKPEEYFLDRLLLAGIIECRGHERFAMIAEHAADPQIKKFYDSIARSEERHHELFIELAKHYFNVDEVYQRLEELLVIEADIVKNLPLRAALH